MTPSQFNGMLAIDYNKILGNLMNLLNDYLSHCLHYTVCQGHVTLEVYQ